MHNWFISVKKKFLKKSLGIFLGLAFIFKAKRMYLQDKKPVALFVLS